jgi:hypothetical protein
MSQNLAGLGAGVALGLGALSGLAYGGDEVTPPPAAPSTGPDTGLDLSIRARALGIVPESLTAPSLDFEAQRAPTGAGSMRWPSARTEIAPGVFVTMMPSCGPEDELWRLPGRRPGHSPRR